MYDELIIFAIKAGFEAMVTSVKKNNKKLVTSIKRSTSILISKPGQVYFGPLIDVATYSLLQLTSFSTNITMA
jgi:hypothetical protein